VELAHAVRVGSPLVLGRFLGARGPAALGAAEIIVPIHSGRVDPSSGRRDSSTDGRLKRRRSTADALVNWGWGSPSDPFYYAYARVRAWEMRDLPPILRPRPGPEPSRLIEGVGGLACAGANHTQTACRRVREATSGYKQRFRTEADLFAA
jgi:hypothetical protein